MIGMMWFDNNKSSSLEDKISKAVDYFRNKYGRQPAMCFVHPSMMALEVQRAPEKANVAGVDVRTTRQVLPNNFWFIKDSAPDLKPGAPGGPGGHGQN